MPERSSRDARITNASRHRRSEQKEALRQQILAAAAELFLEHGYDGFSMRQLAEQIGYSAATLYLYFRNKDDLLFTVVDDSFARFERSMAEAMAAERTPWAQLVRLGEAYVLFGLQNPAHYQMMFLWRVDFLLQARPGEQHARLDVFDVFRHAVQAAMDAGQLKAGDVQSISDTLWAHLHGMVTLAIAVPRFDAERIRNMFNTNHTIMMAALYRPPVK